MSYMKILIIEDEKLIAKGLKKGLENHKYCVDIASKGEEAYKLIQDYEYDIIILDLILPDIEGEKICKKLRAEKNYTPILMLTAKKHINNIVEGLNIGADDYLTKPFDFQELLARIRVLLRRNAPAKECSLFCSGIKLSIGEEKIFIDGIEKKFSKKEFMILEYLLRNKGFVLSRNQILEHSWDMNVDMFTNVVDAHIKNIRKKLGKYGDLVETVYGSGYRLRKD